MFEPKLENVESVYSGKNGMCCCGCSGKHFYPESMSKRGVEIRGYKIGEDEVSDRSVKRIFNKVFGGKLGPALQNTVGEDQIYYNESENCKRIYIVYFKENA